MWQKADLVPKWDERQDRKSTYGYKAKLLRGARLQLQGKIDATRQLLPRQIDELRFRMGRPKQTIAKLARRISGSNKLHQKRRRLAGLEVRLQQLEEARKAGRVGPCFGSRKLSFRLIPRIRPPWERYTTRPVLDSTDQGAAIAIARRGLGRSERPAVRVGRLPARHGGHVTSIPRLLGKRYGGITCHILGTVKVPH
jgi:hypothetical protein